MGNNNPLFNPYIKPGTLHAGGKSKAEVAIEGPIYKLSSNENLLGCAPAALAAAQKALRNIHEYPERTDLPLRKALQSFYHDRLGVENFLTGYGASEIIEAIIRCFLGPGLEYIACSPMFRPYEMFASHVGAKLVDVPLKAENFELDVDGILKAITPNTRLIVLISPNNPTGNIIRWESLQRIVNQLPEHVVLLLDEVYWQFVENPDYTRALPFVLDDKPVIGINSFSKAYGMAGLRVGYAYTTKILAEYIRRLQKAFPLNSISMAAACAALEDFDFIERTVQMIHAEKQKLYQTFEKLHLDYVPSEANFILVKPNISSFEFEQKMLNQGIMVRPADSFGAPGYVRITIGTPEANQALIQALINLLA